MLLRIYIVFYIIFIVLHIMASIFYETEFYNNKRCHFIYRVAIIGHIINIVYLVIFVIYGINTNGGFIAFGIINGIFEFLLIWSAPPFMVCTTTHVDYASEDGSLVMTIVLLIIMNIVNVCAFGIASTIPLFRGTEEYETITEHIETIQILSYGNSSTTSVNGSRYYIKSEPGVAYYYKIATDNGGTTIKTIDGIENYVETIEDKTYSENPHIEVYKSETYQYFVNSYETYYKDDIPISTEYEYYIYVPEDSTFYQ